MRVSLKPMDKVLEARAHPSGGYGKDWTWGCVIEPRGDVALIHLAQRAPTDDERRALIAALVEAGFKRAAWERRKCGESRWTREFELCQSSNR